MGHDNNTLPLDIQLKPIRPFNSAWFSQPFERGCLIGWVARDGRSILVLPMCFEHGVSVLVTLQPLRRHESTL